MVVLQDICYGIRIWHSFSGRFGQAKRRRKTRSQLAGTIAHACRDETAGPVKQRASIFSSFKSGKTCFTAYKFESYPDQDTLYRRSPNREKPCHKFLEKGGRFGGKRRNDEHTKTLPLKFQNFILSHISDFEEFVRPNVSLFISRHHDLDVLNSLKY